MDTVLMVADNPMQAELARIGLEAQGSSVTVPGDGMEALALAPEHRPVPRLPHLWAWESVASHVQLEWSQPVWGRYLEELARHNKLIRYDARGSGLSDRIQPAGVEDQLLDLEAVVARLGLDAFALSANQSMSPVALMFAARYPIRFVATYGPPSSTNQSRRGQPLDQEMIDRLRSLGYVR